MPRRPIEIRFGRRYRTIRAALVRARTQKNWHLNRLEQRNYYELIVGHTQTRLLERQQVHTHARRRSYSKEGDLASVVWCYRVANEVLFHPRLCTTEPVRTLAS